MDASSIISKIDHSLLSPNLTLEQIKNGCEFALTYKPHSIYVQPFYIDYVKQELRGSEVKLGTVVAFPHGNELTSTKIHAVKEALRLGADELDVVMNIPAALNGDYEYIETEIREIVNVAIGKIIKVILETAFLTDTQISLSCQAIERANAHYVKTSTGFAATGATTRHVALMRRSVSPRVRIKASGGIRTLEQVLAMSEAGADLIASSSTESIVVELGL